MSDGLENVGGGGEGTFGAEVDDGMDEDTDFGFEAIVVRIFEMN